METIQCRGGVRQWEWILGVLLAVAGLLACSSVQADEKTTLWNWNADARFRHEYLQTQGSPERHRQRIRARVGLTAQPADVLEAGLSLTTGSTDPVSQNETLDSGFSRKPIALDLAYFTWKPSSEARAVFGKMKNPYFAAGDSELIWDHDLRFEGMAGGWKKNFGFWDIDWNDGLFWIDERSSEPDSFLVGVDLGFGLRPLGESSPHRVRLGTAWYAFSQVKGRSPFVDATKSAGNTLDSNKYAQDYRVLNPSLVFESELLGRPMAVFLDCALNTAAASKKMGWLVGATFGKIKEGGDFAIRYNFRRLEADAVVGAFTDSDFREGGTDGYGHEIGVEYAFLKQFQAGLTGFINAKGVGESVNFTRVQADLAVKF